MNAEQRRLDEARRGIQPWKKWGPYLTERQWGTVREDYSPGGNPWEYTTHDMARSLAYRWGEEGIGGISDEGQTLCLALAFWNGRDPILKERLFGLTNGQGNHGEDVKELYYYLDSTPTHSYMKMLYKYPQAEFPYERLVEEGRRRGKGDPEFEILDTGVFDGDRYFDVFIEYAKAAPEDILIRVRAENRGPREAPLHLLPLIWFRNTWSWEEGARKPLLSLAGNGAIQVHGTEGQGYHLHQDGGGKALFCENESNRKRLYGAGGESGFFKDGINDFVVRGLESAVHPRGIGTRAAFLFRFHLPPGGSAAVRLRLARDSLEEPFGDFDDILERRRQEADTFYRELQADLPGEDARHVQRQALAGLLWSKQFYHYEVSRWLQGDPGQPPPPRERRLGRNREWLHLENSDIISMPDKWEYPWYAAWDLAFHTIPLALVDPDFAKQQLVLMTRERYMHPNGQLPAYEWEFSDANPPVHAWATWRVFQIERRIRGGPGDLAFLERIFLKLLLNFTWWVNRKDAQGLNIFQGGFLGLDNIGVFDRSAPLPTGGFINQAAGTSWMAMYSLNLMRIALELALHNPVYQDIAIKFFEHFLHIARAMTDMAGQGIGLWCDEDKFYYDELNLPDGRIVPLKVRSMVGLIPLFAVDTLEPELLEKVPLFKERLEWLLSNRPDLARLVSRWHEPGRGERRLLSLLRGHRMKCLLRRVLDETEFLSGHGVRALSRHYRDHPYVFFHSGKPITITYQPAESDSYMFGGNSNWRGPIWFPVNYLLIESLQKFHHYYSDDFKIECPTGSGQYRTINQVAQEITRRLVRIFLRDERGRRPVFGNREKMQTDPHFRDYILFHEYFNGDDGSGVGTSHQTGWTALVAKLLQPRRKEGE